MDASIIMIVSCAIISGCMFLYLQSQICMNSRR